MSAPEQPASRPRRFVRTRRGRLIGGVCSGLGSYFGVDPLLLRIAFVGLALLGGLGVGVYALIVLLTVEEGATRAPIRVVRVRLRTAIGIAALAIALIWLVDAAGHAALDDSWPFVGAVLLIAGVAAGGTALWSWLRARSSGRRRSPDERLFIALALGTALTAAAVLVGGAGIWLAGTQSEAAAWVVVVIGIAVTISAFGRAGRWVLPAAIAFSIPVAVALAADVDLRGGVGEKTYRPATAEDLRSSYRFGAGQLTVDLRDVPLSGRVTTVDVRLGAGELDVLVPRDACVTTEAVIGAGYVGALDRESGGLDVDWSNRPEARTDAPRLVIRAKVGLGALFVADRPLGRGRHRFQPGAYGDNDACRRELQR